MSKKLDNKVNVLVLDDDQDILDLVCSVIADHNIIITSANNGLKGLEFFKKNIKILYHNDINESVRLMHKKSIRLFIFYWVNKLKIFNFK